MKRITRLAGHYDSVRVTRFYIPLLLQAFSQSLTYPLVAGIVTHGACGANGLTAFSQGQMIMFLIGSLGAGLITTGLVFARTPYGYISYKRLNLLMMSVLITCQCVPALPPFGHWVFEGLFALPPELATVARWTLLGGVFMNGAFFLRNVPLVLLFNNFESGKANLATLARIAFTLVCSAVFPHLGWCGPGWGLVAISCGVFLELWVSWVFARPYARALQVTDGMPLPRAAEIAALAWEQFRFTLPLAFGGLLLATAPLVIAAFVARTAAAGDMLIIHYMTLGIANPVAYAALRLQTVAVKFPPEYPGDRRLLVYAVIAGLALGLIPFVFSLPLVGDWYFGRFQNVPRHLLGTVELAIGLYSFIAVFHAVRARIEGIAAFQRRPSAVMAGQIAYTVSLFLTCLVLLPTGCAGWKMAMTAIYVAPACTAMAVYATLAWVKTR